MEVAEAKKYVWWDLDCWNRDRDPYEIRCVIESALNKKFGAGPVTVFAIGNTNRISRRVLELISRAGIIIKHTPHGATNIKVDLVSWTLYNPPPAILMLISDREYYYCHLNLLKDDGYTILRTYVNQKQESPEYASAVWLWKDLFTDTKQEITRHKDLEGETDWFCELCNLGGQSFTDFISHRMTRTHLLWEWSTVYRHCSALPTDSELASFYYQLMKYDLKQLRPKPDLSTVHPDSYVELTDSELASLPELKMPEQYEDLRHYIDAYNQRELQKRELLKLKSRNQAAGPTDAPLASLERKRLKWNSRPNEAPLAELQLKQVSRNWAAGPSEARLASLKLKQVSRNWAAGPSEARLASLKKNGKLAIPLVRMKKKNRNTRRVGRKKVAVEEEQLEKKDAVESG